MSTFVSVFLDQEGIVLIAEQHPERGPLLGLGLALPVLEGEVEGEGVARTLHFLAGELCQRVHIEFLNVNVS